MIICPVCKSENLEGTWFCDNCGTNLREPVPMPSQTQTITPPDSMPSTDTYLQPSKDTSLSPGEIIDSRFRIINRLQAWEDGLSYAYLAIDEKLGRKCVIKQSEEYYLSEPSERRLIYTMLEKEVRILTSLWHPNLIRASDFFFYKNGICTLVDFVDGPTLQEILDKSKEPLPENQVLSWAIQLCDVLSYLHGQNPPIIHRNIKPKCIILEKGTQDRVRLINFEIAHFGQRMGEEKWGTVGYSPPEQVSMGRTDARSDIFGLGVTLYVLLTKYDQNSLVNFQFPDIRSINPKVSQPTVVAISRALQLKPEDRYQSAAEMRTALGAIMGVETRSVRSLRVFLCHSSSDKPIVRTLYNRLKDDGLDPWLDEQKLLPGQDWNLEITKEVRASDIVVVCLSRRSINKAGYVQKEIKYALDVADEQPEGTIFIIPLKLEECEVPARLCRWQWLNFFKEDGYEKLMRALHHRASTLGMSSDMP